MKNLSNIKYAVAYPDNSGNRMSLEIDMKEKDERFQCKINDEKIWCSLNDLVWLRDAITDAIIHINKPDKNKEEKSK